MTPEDNKRLVRRALRSQLGLLAPDAEPEAPSSR
jgi:hypothetical protein